MAFIEEFEYNFLRYPNMSFRLHWSNLQSQEVLTQRRPQDVVNSSWRSSIIHTTIENKTTQFEVEIFNIVYYILICIHQCKAFHILRYPDADIVHVGFKNNADHETAYHCFGGFIEPLFHFLKKMFIELKIEPNKIPSDVISNPAFPEKPTN